MFFVSRSGTYLMDTARVNFVKLQSCAMIEHNKDLRERLEDMYSEPDWNKIIEGTNKFDFPSSLLLVPGWVNRIAGACLTFDERHTGLTSGWHEAALERSRLFESGVLMSRC